MIRAARARGRLHSRPNKTQRQRDNRLLRNVSRQGGALCPVQHSPARRALQGKRDRKARKALTCMVRLALLRLLTASLEY